LDLSGNKFDKVHVEDIAKQAPEMTALKVLRLAQTGLSAEHIRKLLAALHANAKISELNVDLSDNDLGAKGMDVIFSDLKTSTKLRVLDVSDNGLKGKGVLELLAVLPRSVERLILDGNLGSDGVEDLAQDIGKLLAAHPSLTALSVAGKKDKAIGKKMPTLVAMLDGNRTLRELDLSKNKMGDIGMSALCAALRQNTTLQRLIVDKNNVRSPRLLDVIEDSSSLDLDCAGLDYP